MKKIILSFLLAGSLIATPALSAKRNVVIASEFALPPYNSVGSENIQGFEVDLINEIAEINNWEVRFVKMPFKYLFSLLNNNEVDLLTSGLFNTPQRTQDYAVSTPYFIGNDSAFYINPELKIQSIDDLKKLKIAAIGNSAHYRRLLELGVPNENIIQEDSYYLIFREVLLGNADAAFGYEVVFKDIAKTRQGNFNYYIPSATDAPKREIIAITKKNNPELVQEFDRAVATLIENGRYEALKNKWFVQ